MIALRQKDQIEKIWSDDKQLHLVLHPTYGWVESQFVPFRDAHRKKQGFATTTNLTNCPEVTIDSASRKIVGTNGLVEVDKNLFHFVANNNQKYTFDWIEDVKIEPNHISKKESPWLGRSIAALFFVVILLMGYQLLSPSAPTDVASDKQVEDIEMIQMEPIKEVQKLPEVKPEEMKNQAIDETVKAQKAVTQNLGFLKLLGRKDLKKAVGGLPTQTANATAGAGAGGDKGSGGELLTGIGDGLRKTTVGNTGTKGLGGIGTEGAGGGLGGYGDSLISSGAGRALSTVPLARQATIEGGLDRSLIQATILRYLSQIRACYEEGLKQKPDMIGQVTTAFEINGQGLMNSVKIVKSALNNAFVDNCITERMMTWKFPTPRGGSVVKVTYPFMLRPVGK